MYSYILSHFDIKSRKKGSTIISVVKKVDFFFCIEKNQLLAQKFFIINIQSFCHLELNATQGEIL